MSQFTNAVSKTRFPKVGDGRIVHDDASGDGRLIVAIPVMELGAQYRYLTPALRNAVFPVVVMDVRAFGVFIILTLDVAVQEAIPTPRRRVSNTPIGSPIAATCPVASAPSSAG